MEPPASQCPLGYRFVKINSSAGTGRLPSASSLPQAVQPTKRHRLASLATPFRPRHSPWARSPSTPPAEAGVACLDLTLLADICNHTKARAHPANDHSPRDGPFLTRRCLSILRLRAVCVRDFRPRRGTEIPPHRSEHLESACALRQQRPAQTTLSTPRSPCQSRSGAGDSIPRQAGQDIPSNPPRERYRLSGTPEVLSVTEKPERFALTT